MAGIRRKQNKTKDIYQQTDEVQAAIDYGIDISVLIQNIARPCIERIMRHQFALNTVEKLRKAELV
jgi:hypothetical protein